MNADEQNGGERQDHGVEHVETKQGVGIHSVAAHQDETQLGAHHRDGRHDVSAHRSAPVGQLVPRQQITGVTEQQCQQQQAHAHHPVQLPRWPEGATIKHLGHVREYQEHHGMGGPAVQVAQEHAVR